MKKKKAIFVANTGFALFNFRLSLMKALKALDWEVVGIANDEADYADKFKSEGLNFIHVDIDHKGKNPLNDILLAKNLASLYEKEAPYFVHHFTVKPVIFGSIAAKKAKIKHIFNTITGLGYAFEHKSILQKIVIKLYKYALSGLPIVIFQNQNDRDIFISLGITMKASTHIIMGSGVDTEKIRPRNHLRKKNKFTFLMISRMLWSKGVAEFVQAARHVKALYPETSFTMAGGESGAGAQGNPKAISIEWLMNINSEGIAHWHGRISSDEVLDLLINSDVFVLPSYYPEGIPKVLIEAAASGMPIITTNTPGCRDIAINGVNGLTVPVRDVDSIVTAMIKFIEHPELIKKMGIESRKRAEEVFDTKHIIKQTLQLYQKTGISV